MRNYYTAKEYALKTGVCYKTVLAWIKSGAITSDQKVPHGRHFVNKLDIPAFMREKEGKNGKS